MTRGWGYKVWPVFHCKSCGAVVPEPIILTVRERQLLLALKRHPYYGYKQIAVAVVPNSTPGTIKVHMHHIMKKFGIENKGHLVAELDRLLALQ